MPRTSTERVVDRHLDESDSGRYIDLRVDLLLEGEKKAIFTAGGRWDRRRKRYTGSSTKSRVLRIHPGQLEAALWIAAWMVAHKRGETLKNGDEDIWSAAFVGGRRGGKSNLAMKVAVLFAILMPRSIVWIVSPTFPDTDEVERELEEELLPSSWYTKIGRPDWEYTLVNGSKILLKSSTGPSSTLKKGRVDLAVLNEAQRQKQSAFVTVRGGTSDHGGLTLLAANPPDDVKGEWVAEVVEKAEAKRIGCKVLKFDAKKNPKVKYRSLEALAKEVDERTYRREVLGEFLPRTDVVLYSWSELNRAPIPELGMRDVTAEICEKVFGFPYTHLLGGDLQLQPHECLVVARLFEDPENPLDTLLWFEAEVVVEQGTEHDLIDALERLVLRGKRLVPKDTGIILDASSFWQDVERNKGRSSTDVFKARGWRNLYKPDENLEKNPLIAERVNNANRRFRTADKRQHAYADPRCEKLINALKKWPIKFGRPDKRSEFAHLGDASTYLIHRLYPQRIADEPFEYDRVPRPPRGGWEKMNGRPKTPFD